MNNKKSREELTNAVRECLSEIKDKGYNRITFNISELSEKEAKENRPTGWMNTTPYYPNEIISPDEIDIMNKEGSYQVASFVNNETPGVRKYDGNCLEIINRIRIYPLLLKMDPTSKIYYSNSADALLNLNDETIDMLAETGMTADDLRKGFRKGVEEYRKATENMFEKEGVYDSLKRLEERKTESDAVMHGLKKIYSNQ
ncbi:MAG: hypothetical protein ACP5OA_00510 [Candidatus Woesearchaeota archaeon]